MCNLSVWTGSLKSLTRWLARPTYTAVSKVYFSSHSLYRVFQKAISCPTAYTGCFKSWFPVPQLIQGVSKVDFSSHSLYRVFRKLTSHPTAYTGCFKSWFLFPQLIQGVSKVDLSSHSLYRVFQKLISLPTAYTACFKSWFLVPQLDENNQEGRKMAPATFPQSSALMSQHNFAKFLGRPRESYIMAASPRLTRFDSSKLCNVMINDQLFLSPGM
jgi:hypothetical protein